MINGGGRIQGDCGSGATFWINLAVNGHNQDGRIVATVNGMVPDGQCVPAGSFKSVPICVAISGNRAYVTSQVTETLGSYFTNFGVVPGSYHRFSFDDNGNPAETSIKDKVGLFPMGSDPHVRGRGQYLGPLHRPCEREHHDPSVSARASSLERAAALAALSFLPDEGDHRLGAARM